MRRGNSTRSVKPTPTDISKATAPREREANTMGKPETRLDGPGWLRCALKGGLYLTKKVAL